MAHTTEIYAKRVRQEREQANMSIADVAAKTGISEEDLLAIEAGEKLDSLTMRKIALAHDVSPYSLFSTERYDFLEAVGPPEGEHGDAMRKFGLNLLEDMQFVRREYKRLQDEGRIPADDIAE